MGDKKTLAKARMELEELYSGIPDDSVNLTFQDFAQVANKTEKKKNMEVTKQSSSSALGKLPSLDFSRGLEASRQFQSQNEMNNNNSPMVEHTHNSSNHMGYHFHHRGNIGHVDHHSPRSRNGSEFRQSVALESSVAYDRDVSMISTASTYVGDHRGGQLGLRPGIPHSKICTICSTYIYIFRHRCLVCGRVYCRDCLSSGMGDMSEGRKCIQCLGKKFSPRYIQRAGKVSCFCFGYPATLKQVELKWAEKGPRRRRDGAHGPNSRTPTSPLTPRSNHNTPSFVAPTTPSYSPYSTPTHHHLPL
ncbi:hypothetical protein ACFE04_015723 [Oxalis oulophora]